MTININVNELNHLKEESHYNYNFYSYGNMGLKLLQICHEESDTYDYYLIDEDNKVLLGSAGGCDESAIDFMHKYT